MCGAARCRAASATAATSAPTRLCVVDTVLPPGASRPGPGARRGPVRGAGPMERQPDGFCMATVGRCPVGHHAGVGGSSRAEEVAPLDADLVHVAPPPCADGVAGR